MSQEDFIKIRKLKAPIPFNESNLFSVSKYISCEWNLKGDIF